MYVNIVTKSDARNTVVETTVSSVTDQERVYDSFGESDGMNF